MTELPIENIKEVYWKGDKVFITYKDKTTLISNSNDIKLVSNYKNKSDHPLVDHCI